MKFFISFVIFSLFLNRFTTAQTLIQTSCKKAAAIDPNLTYDFCVQSLEQDPESKSAKTLVDLLKSSTKIAAAKNTDVIGVIQQMLKSKKFDERTEALLDNCVVLLSDVIVEYKNSLGFVKSRDYSSANDLLGGYCLSAPVDCNDGFEELEKPNPISNETDVLFHTVVIPVVFSSMLK